MKNDYSIYNDKKERCNLTRKIASEGFVLLKNEDSLLPLKCDQMLAIFGRAQIDTISGGTGSANLSTEYNVSISDGLDAGGALLYMPLVEKYRKWIEGNPIPSYGVWGSGMHANPEMPIAADDVQAAYNAGARFALVVLGRTAGENDDVTLSAGDYYLSDDEKTIFKAVTAVFDNVIVILNTTGLIDLGFIEDFKIKSLLYMNVAGLESGNALADVLLGKVSPSGKLTDTIAKSYEDYPTFGHFGQSCGGLTQDYVEDIYVGYRYFESFKGKSERVLYPFGFGLSYTEFEISNYSFSDLGGSVSLSATIKNTGTVSGKEVVQFYFSAPSPESGAKLYKPLMNLCGFKKTALLQPSQTETVCVTVKKDELASFDDTGATGFCDCRVLEAGEYTFYAGNSVADARANTIGSFEQKSLGIVERCHHLKTALPSRLIGDGSYEKLDTIKDDPICGIRIGEEISTVTADMFASCDGDPKCLKNGECAVYRLMMSSSGRYGLVLNFSKPSEFALSVCGKELDTSSAEKRGNSFVFSSVVLPTGLAVVSLTSKGGAYLESFTTEKENSSADISDNGESRVEADAFYECAYSVFGNICRDTEGKITGFLYQMQSPGRFVTYKVSCKSAGNYDLSFVYSNSRNACTLNRTMAIFVSNVGQSVKDVAFEKTCNEHEFCFKTSESVRVSLPAGESYLKLVSASKNFPDISCLLFARSSDQSQSNGGSSLVVVDVPQTEFEDESTELEKAADVSPEGIQLSDVYNGRNTLDEFVSQLSDDELSLLVSGSPLNRIPIGTTGTTSPLYKRGVPSVQTADGPLGLRLRTKAVAFPGGTLLASTWNPSLALEMGAAFAFEAKKHQVDCVLGPGLNIHRDIRCGRCFEYFSEDPLIAGTFAAGVTLGLQSNGISAMPKHFAANSTEHERLQSNSRVSARALREIYFRGFEILIKTAQPWAIMSSYNYINNVKVCETYNIITSVVRGEWGFDGIFCTDWYNNSNHVREILAGHDVKMNSGNIPAIKTALSDGTLTRENLEPCAKRVLKFVMKSNYFLKNIK